MASFEYELGTHDYAAFNMHHLMTSDMARRQWRAFRLAFVGATAILSVFVVGMSIRELIPIVVAGVLGSVIAWLISPFLWKRSVRHNIHRMAEADGLGTPGRHVLTLDGDGIREQSPTATVTAPWSSLLRVDDTPDYLFIYTDPVRGFVVPKRIGAERVAELQEMIAAHSVWSS